MSMPEGNLNRLPVFDNHYGRPDHWRGLRVDGLVAEPMTFSAADLEGLARSRVTDDFSCEEGWTVADQKWEGVSLAQLLDKVRPLDGAAYAAVSASDYMVAVRLTTPEGSEAEGLEAEQVLLANRLNDDILPVEHGGPCRLIIAGAACYASIKWVDHICLTAEKPEETAQQIAEQRNESSD